MLTDDELAAIRKRAQDGRAIDYCPDCKHEAADYDMHPRSDGTWNARCTYCFDSIVPIPIWGCRDCRDLLEEIDCLRAEVAQLRGESCTDSSNPSKTR